MNFMSLTRMIALLLVGWTVLALGMGALGLGTHAPEGTFFFCARPALHDVVSVGTPDRPGDYHSRLVDRITGESSPISVPGEQTWEFLSVAPWRDREGRIEAVGRWTNLQSDPSDRPFCGLGLIKLPAGPVTTRVTLDVLPTGRPCMVPGRPGEVLFPTGDGQLYRCNLTAGAPEPDADDDTSAPDTRPVEQPARPISWRCQMPGEGHIFINDPFWPTDPRLRDFVFVTINAQHSENGRFVYDPSRVWWLKLSESGDEVVAAGGLESTDEAGGTARAMSHRFPTVAATAGGKLGLVFVTHTPREPMWRLRWARLEIDPGTRLPVTIRETAELAELAPMPSPPIMSSDGTRVFAVAANGAVSTVSLVRPESKGTH